MVLKFMQTIIAISESYNVKKLESHQVDSFNRENKPISTIVYELMSTVVFYLFCD